MDELLTKVKANLILEHTADDALIQSYITAAVSYAESYQHIPEGTYQNAPMPPTTEQAVIMLASHFYESRDGGTEIGRFEYESWTNERLCRHCKNKAGQGQRGLHPLRGRSPCVHPYLPRRSARLSAVGEPCGIQRSHRPVPISVYSGADGLHRSCTRYGGWALRHCFRREHERSRNVHRSFSEKE